MKEHASPPETRHCPVVAACECGAETSTFGEAEQPNTGTFQLADRRSQIEIPQSAIANPQSAISYPTYPTGCPLHCSAPGMRTRSETYVRGGRLAAKTHAWAMSSGFIIRSRCSLVGGTGRLFRMGVSQRPG